ncbi:hypothetical protein J5893_02210 [bacterium]|nr:hypothetical protein [bacterium]
MPENITPGAENKPTPPRNPIRESLESELSHLIADEKSGISDLAKFGKHLSSSEKIQRTPSQKEKIKADLQNSKLITFEGGERNEMRFGFEELGNDIKPTITPNGDVILPVNFRYNAQTRTKLVILHARPDKEQIIYELPNGTNSYEIEIGKEKFLYELFHDANGFRLALKQ